MCFLDGFTFDAFGRSREDGITLADPPHVPMARKLLLLLMLLLPGGFVLVPLVVLWWHRRRAAEGGEPDLWWQTYMIRWRSRAQRRRSAAPESETTP